MKKEQLKAILYAVVAAVFFAVSTPLSKILLAFSTPTMLAAFLYIGAGSGIGILSLVLKNHAGEETKLCRSDLPYVIGMILLDIMASLLLMNGIARTSAANVSLLNNFEIVATAVFAYFLFKENISKRMWTALLLVTLSSVILSLEGQQSFHFTSGSILVIGSAVCWGLENNCTKMISGKSTYEIVTIKGLCSGTVSLVIACILSEKFPPLLIIGAIMMLGFVTYGLSIFAYIRAQAVIGAAKTSAFYAMAPFIGSFLSFLLLQEKLSAHYLIGLAVMMLGSFMAVYDTLRYHHCHMHSHTVFHLHHGVLEKEVITHCHEHSHIGPGLAHHHLHSFQDESGKDNHQGKESIPN